MKIAVFDVETTGLDPKSDHIIEFGVVVLEEDSEEFYRGNWLIDHGITIPFESTRIHGITNKMVREEGHPWGEVGGKIKRVLEGCDVWCGHNIEFDISFVKSAIPDIESKPIIDTMWLGRRYIPNSLLRSKSLGAMCGHYGIDLLNAHRAVYDAEATGRLAFSICKDVGLSIDDLLTSEARTVGRHHIGRDPFRGLLAGQRKKTI